MYFIVQNNNNDDYCHHIHVKAAASKRASYTPFTDAFEYATLMAIFPVYKFSNW